MVNLEEIRIKNYRSLVDTKIELKTNLSALIGRNGVGKTNILSGILLLKKMTYDGPRYRGHGLVDSESAHSELHTVIKVDKVRYGIKADIYFDTTEENNRINHAEIKIRNLEKKASKWMSIKPDTFAFVDHFRNRKIPVTLSRKYLTANSDINEALKLISHYLTNFSYYSATQFSDPAKSPISLELEDSRLSTGYSPSRRTHEKFLYDLFIKYTSDKKSYNRYLNTVGKLGLNLIEDIAFAEHEIPSSSIKVLAGGHIRKISTKRKIVIPSFTIDDLQLSPNQLSEGTFKTLALIFYVLNDDSDLLLIEEPEVCVHHGLLGSVIELIKLQSKKKQIIISTHSDYVMDKLDPENVIVVRKTKEGTTAETLSDALPKDDFEALRTYLNETGNLGEYWKESGFSND